MKLFGQRTIKYKDASNTQGIIYIEAYTDRPVSVNLEEGETVKDYSGEIKIHCDLFTRTIKASGDDQLHLSMLLMWLSDVWLRHVCNENGITIFKYVEGDIEEEFSVYKP